MQTGVQPKATDDRRDFVVIPSDQVRVAPSDAEITDLLRAAARQHSESGPRAASDSSTSVSVLAVDTTFRATDVNADVPARSSFGRRMLRALAALLLAAGITSAALGWQTFGYVAKKALISWAPKWAIAASLPLEKLGLATEAKPSDPPTETTPAQQADASPPAAADVSQPAPAVANTAAPSSDSAQQLQSMARDLANAHQEIETLKANIAELKAGQQQMVRDLAKAAAERTAEQAVRAKAAAARKLTSPPSYSPTATSAAAAPAYRPTPSTYSVQAAVPPAPPPAAAQPYVPPPVQLQPQSDPGMPSTAPRPPMPVQ